MLPGHWWRACWRAAPGRLNLAGASGPLVRRRRRTRLVHGPDSKRRRAWRRTCSAGSPRSARSRQAGSRRYASHAMDCTRGSPTAGLAAEIRRPSNAPRAGGGVEDASSRPSATCPRQRQAAARPAATPCSSLVEGWAPTVNPRAHRDEQRRTPGVQSHRLERRREAAECPRRRGLPTATGRGGGHAQPRRSAAANPGTDAVATPKSTSSRSTLAAQLADGRLGAIKCPNRVGLGDLNGKDVPPLIAQPRPGVCCQST